MGLDGLDGFTIVCGGIEEPFLPAPQSLAFLTFFHDVNGRDDSSRYCEPDLFDVPALCGVLVAIRSTGGIPAKSVPADTVL